MLYFGNLTAQVDELAPVDRVNVLALPYCPANRNWLAHTRFLIGRFSPDVVLVHHYDNFWHPYTHPKLPMIKNSKPQAPVIPDNVAWHRVLVIGF